MSSFSLQKRPDKPKMRLFCLLVLFAVSSLLFLPKTDAQPPAGYYETAAGLTGKTLQKALHDIIDNHTVVAYNSLYAYFQKTDVKNDSIVWDMYSDIPGGNAPYLYKYSKNMECGNYAREGDCYNREHSFPKSWFNDASPMYSDLFHLYPTDGYVNNRRANYPFGETKNATWISKNGSKVGPCSWPGYAGIVFEPIDEYKGDFARTMFYMATRYFGEDANWPGSDMVTGAEPKNWARDMLLNWHRKDTVSLKERNRNNEVYNVQFNRNPFIDNPLLAEKIWGTTNETNESLAEKYEFNLSPNPAKEYIKLSGNAIPEQMVQFVIYTLNGTAVAGKKIENSLENIQIGNLKPGIYLVKITSQKQTQVLKFVKE